VSQLVPGVVLGTNIAPGRHQPVVLAESDRWSHVNIVGKTSVGKSTLMHNMIRQDIAAGRGVAVIDPHGKLVRDILRTSIPKRRVADVVVIDIANENYPPPLNPLVVAPSARYVAVGQLMAVLDKLYGGFQSAPRVRHAGSCFEHSPA
jgi:DNA helicase HerA-like ATPase